SGRCAVPSARRAAPRAPPRSRARRARSPRIRSGGPHACPGSFASRCGRVAPARSARVRRAPSGVCLAGPRERRPPADPGRPEKEDRQAGYDAVRTGRPPMQQLPGADSIFLALETPTLYMHTGALTILDPAGSPGLGFQRLRETIAERIVQAPRFTLKLREVPFGLDRPYFVEDPDIDVRRHLHRVGCPSPGGPRELAELVGDIAGRALDRRHALWELWFVEGLEGGRVATVMKTHHCLVDGVSGAGLGEILADLEPDPPPRPPPPRPPPPP